MMPSTTTAKFQARRLREDLSAAGVTVSHARALELVAQLHGVRDWNTLVVTAASDAQRPEQPHAGPAVPVLRVRSAQVAVLFYVTPPPTGTW